MRLDNAISNGYMTVEADDTVRIYPKNFTGMATTTEEMALFDGTSRLIVSHVMVNTSGGTSGTITIANHAGTAIDVLDWDSLAAGNVIPIGRRAAGLSVIAAGGITDADIKVYFSVFKGGRAAATAGAELFFLLDSGSNQLCSSLLNELAATGP